MFMQHWYWYPLMNFMNLALTPTALIGLNKSLKVPKSFKCTSNAKASTYKYPEFIKLDKDKKKEKVVQESQVKVGQVTELLEPTVGAGGFGSLRLMFEEHSTEVNERMDLSLIHI